MISNIEGWRTMSFGEDGPGQRAEAAEQGSTATRLNQLPADGPASSPGGTSKLVSTPAEKKAAADTIANELLTSTKKAGNHADEANAGAVGALSGWATAGALKKVQTTWDGQVKTLLGRLSKERDGLKGAVGTLSGVDSARRSELYGIKTPSAFDGYQ
ncbi:hypothetical protein [Streptomyces sp. NPDC050428]|uniref:hypothetical protein n=1 Tax=Streptomyces sp. NPDC050428 TaxID=3155757 RepID=UPI00341EE955